MKVIEKPNSLEITLSSKEIAQLISKQFAKRKKYTARFVKQNGKDLQVPKGAILQIVYAQNPEQMENRKSMLEEASMINVLDFLEDIKKDISKADHKAFAQMCTDFRRREGVWKSRTLISLIEKPSARLNSYTGKKGAEILLNHLEKKGFYFIDRQ
jgi:hypothetical protein